MPKPATKTSAFLAALFDGCEGLIEVRAIPVSKEDGRSIHRAFFSRDAISDVLDWCRLRLGGDDSLYVAVATRRSDVSGALENCQGLPALFVDCDFKDSSEGAVRARLEVFSLQPSIVVHSGHGLHAYWLLKEPIDLGEDAAEAGQLLRRLAAHLQGDPAAAEPARVLRIPGTYNRKDTPAVRVVTECLDPDRRYTTFDLNEALPEVTEHAVIATTTPLSPGTPIPKGRRNPELYTRGRKIKAAGLSPAAIEAALRAEVCEPPLPPAELDAVIRQVLTQPDRSDFQGGGGADVILDADNKVPVVTQLSTVTPVPIDWLWEGRIAKGKSTLLAGDPGLGKTTIAVDIAARCSTGRAMPDGTVGQLGNTLILTAEDDLADTIRPRVDRLGGDSSRVYALEAVRDASWVIRDAPSGRVCMAGSKSSRGMQRRKANNQRRRAWP